MISFISKLTSILVGQLNTISPAIFLKFWYAETGRTGRGFGVCIKFNVSSFTWKKGRK